jgi:hypothetical protein
MLFNTHTSTLEDEVSVVGAEGEIPGETTREKREADDE